MARTLFIVSSKSGSTLPVFVYQRLTSAPDAAQDRAMDALAAAGHPVIAGSLRAHLNSIQANDYFALLAYIEMNRLTRLL